MALLLSGVCKASTPGVCFARHRIRSLMISSELKKAFISSQSHFFVFYISMYSDFMINADFDTFCALNLNKICLV